MHFRTLPVLTLLAIVCHTIQPSFGATSRVYDSCVGSLCFGLPINCIASTDCQFLFRSHHDPTSGVFQLELTAPSIAADRYIAVGFTNSSDMSGLVVHCAQSTSTSQSAIQYAFNQYGGIHSSAPVANQIDVTGFSNLQATYQDGQLQCRWQVQPPAKVEYNGIVFDFDEENFYIQLATGPFNAADNRLTRHSDRVSSSSSVSLKSNSTIQGAGMSTAVRWHASLMIFGWIGCVTVAILMARFTRDLWPDQKLLGQKHWFVFHRSLMAIGWLAIMAGYIINFVHFKGWSGTSSHSVIGIVAGILATLQIGNSFLRPAPDSKNRYIFDYAHWIVGNTAHLLAVANIINVGLGQSKAFFWLLIAYLFVYLLFSDLLRKLENRVRAAYSPKKSSGARRAFQLSILFVIAVIVGITAALMGIMFNQN